MPREQVRATLVRMLAEETGGEPRELPDNLSLGDDLGLDSVDFVSLLMRVESEFRIRTTHQELQSVATIGALLDLIESKIATLKAAA